MNEQEIKQMQKRLNNLYLELKHEIGSSTLDIVDEIVSLELALQLEEGQ